MPAVTGRDESWPFFHFWRHHFWPKLASSILHFCRRKRSFQWCPDQSDQLDGAQDINKNAQKVEWKTQSKISCHYTWLLHDNNCPPGWRFLFLRARLHTRFLSRQLDAIFVARKLQSFASFKHVRNPYDIAATKSHWKSHLIYTRVSIGLTVNRQLSKTEYFYRQPSNERAKISRQIFQISINDRARNFKSASRFALVRFFKLLARLLPKLYSTRSNYYY